MNPVPVSDGLTAKEDALLVELLRKLGRSHSATVTAALAMHGPRTAVVAVITNSNLDVMLCRRPVTLDQAASGKKGIAALPGVVLQPSAPPAGTSAFEQHCLDALNARLQIRFIYPLTTAQYVGSMWGPYDGPDGRGDMQLAVFACTMSNVNGLVEWHQPGDLPAETLQPEAIQAALSFVMAP